MSMSTQINKKNEKGTNYTCDKRFSIKFFFLSCGLLSPDSFPIALRAFDFIHVSSSLCPRQPYRRRQSEHPYISGRCAESRPSWIYGTRRQIFVRPDEHRWINSPHNSAPDSWFAINRQENITYFLLFRAVIVAINSSILLLECRHCFTAMKGDEMELQQRCSLVYCRFFLLFWIISFGTIYFWELLNDSCCDNATYTGF